MLTINVAPDGSGQFTTISEAVLAVPYDCPAVIRIAPGIYREKLVCEKKEITLVGAGMDATRLVWNDGGKLPHPDGRPTHTFRSYTAFFSGEKLRVEDMTIENDAGPGAKAGQAIAAYVDSARAAFSRVRLLGNQDTLFCAPLPEKEREKDGFLGPRVLAPRRASAQYYHACEIAGDIDFIFGGADALFEHCTLRTVDNGLAHSWVTAPSGAADGLGFVFWDCDFVSDCPAGSVYLGRPRRPPGKTAVLELKNAFTREEVLEIAGILEEEGALSAVIFISFCYQNLLYLREKYPTQPAQFLVGKEVPDDLCKRLIKDKTDLDIYHGSLTFDMVRCLHENGRKVNVWTVNTPEIATRVADMGVDFITTNILE